MLKKTVLFLFTLLALAFTACNPTRNVPQGSYLLDKYEIVADSNVLAKEKFESLMRQKPNRKLVGFIRFHLWLYNKGKSGKDSKFKTGLRKIGEEPVILDSLAIDQTKEQFRIYVNKNGFFNAVVSDSVRYAKDNKARFDYFNKYNQAIDNFKFFINKNIFSNRFDIDSSGYSKNKKATVEYHIKYNQPYIVRSITYTTQDTGIAKTINGFQNSSLIKPGERYNEEILDKERERITNGLKDLGYYFFTRNYITFSIDTAFGNNEASIFLYINRINENVDPDLINNEPIRDHQTYRLRNIYIQTDHNPKNPSLSVPTDTVVYNGYNILTTGNGHIIRHSELTRNIFIKSGNLYLQEKLDYTYRKLQELNIFKFINIYFTEVPIDSTQDKYLLDLFIQLTPTDKMDLTLESEATNTGGNIGLAGSVSYRNKNIFKGAEILELKFRGGLEAIPNFNDSVDEKKFLFFNTYEIGPELSLSFRKIPFFNISPYLNPKTALTLGYNYQYRPDYIRSVTNFSVNFSGSPTKRTRMILTLPEINSVKVNLSPGFQSKLEALNDPRLFYTYDTHVISSVRFTYINSNQNLTSNRNFIFFRINGEYAPKLFDIKYNPAEFYKLDFDISYHQNVNKYNNVVFRLAAGVGVPFGNSTALPFEKSFFAGGANSVRAWNARTLGPGSYKNTVNIEQSGDIKIESNVEYRSEILRLSNGMIIEGATFVDAGNIWTLNEDISRPDGQFQFGHTIEELGIGGGFGLRFNFSFFILRLDAAVKLRDPSLEIGNRWVYPNQKFGISDVTFNLAIGYPF
ncbi:MAG TPA: BamA/TamA family outer membrane protein [Bacteroidia bacterium]|nr:BamA/TamA family outer membrane protein [Bacteroidia bacterium]HQW22559.1 BamA/TamA family outer membrane protein [Bacteroidia bacterium]